MFNYLIINFIKTDGQRRGLKNLNIKIEKDIYSNITRIITELYQWLEKNIKGFISDYNVEARILRQAVKIYLENFKK